MSTVLPGNEVSASAECPNRNAEDVLLRLPARVATLGEGMTIRRALPNQGKRMIGAWCFLDHAGPVDVSHGDGMRVGPHPHTGLQTFTWMVDGEFFHRDSLGCEQLIRPGQVNLMTAGRGISHSEESPAQRSPLLQAAQLWIALPNDKRHIAPAFEHYPELPRNQQDGVNMTLLVGEAFGEKAPTRVYSPLLGMDLRSDGIASTQIPLRPDFEYGVLVLTGSAEVAGETLLPGELLYLGQHRQTLSLHFPEATKILLIGGEPFAEGILLWWNFIGRSQAEIESYIRQWNAGKDFGEVRGYPGERLRAPELPAGMRFRGEAT
ncbi:MAG: pirin family protein [Alcanivoracaceae bacterium]|nr:pirin family protein [Alcanivoracaceae bacterium]